MSSRMVLIAGLLVVSTAAGAQAQQTSTQTKTPEAGIQVTTTQLTGEVMYNRYFRSLYITSRTAVYGTLGFEAEF